ncbi:MAG: DUF1330 domain-containing protein [Roseiflexaceae bacterium]
MSAYVVVEIEVLDQERYETYKQLAPPSIAQYGGRYVARGGEVTTLEGTWSPKRLVILEFPSVDQAKAWWDSTEYAEAKALRQAVARTQMIVVAGL